MKKILAFSLIAAFSLQVSGQISKGKAIVSFQGSYSKSVSSNGATINQNFTNGKYLGLGASFGYFVSDRFLIGCGLNYSWNKELRISSLFLNNTLAQENVEIKSHAFLPVFFLGYYYPVFSKLYISVDARFSYGKIASDFTSYYATATKLMTDSLYSIPRGAGPSMSNINRTAKFDFFSTGIYPQITYFISEKIGFYLGLGGIEYSLIDWKDNNSSMTVNFNPSYWNFGVKFKL